MDNLITKHAKRACDFVGGQAKLARELKVSVVAVHQWVHGQRPVPIVRCVQIERITKGAVSRKDLRPDDWHFLWPELARSRKRKEVAKCD